MSSSNLFYGNRKSLYKSDCGSSGMCPVARWCVVFIIGADAGSYLELVESARRRCFSGDQNRELHAECLIGAREFSADTARLSSQSFERVGRCSPLKKPLSSQLNDWRNNSAIRLGFFCFLFLYFVRPDTEVLTEQYSFNISLLFPSTTFVNLLCLSLYCVVFNGSCVFASIIEGYRSWLGHSGARLTPLPVN